MRVSCLVATVALVSLSACERSQQSVQTPSAGALQNADFVGGKTCYACHESQVAQWRGSHHDQAMQVADETTVLGDFGDARFDVADKFFEFLRRDDDYVVRTNDVAGGQTIELTVQFTFGFEPLQQYLVETANGRFQALNVAWDARPAEAGGQVWFDLYQGDVLPASDPLHWAGELHNWNSRCAACHSTDVRKNYSAEDQRYETSWSSIDVDCEACHGPGSLHVSDPTLPLEFAGPPRSAWTFVRGNSIASRTGAREGGVSEVQVCGPCHARRSQISERPAVGGPMFDSFVPVLLSEGLYFADGQIDDEVFVYGSFTQSAMFAAGVTCSDCHDAHTTSLIRSGNALCGGCHQPAVYDSDTHHRHEAAASGTFCVDCHMPAKTYMGVDPRRDHSFRVPRPDLTHMIGTPNACNGCHADESSEWAANQLRDWFPDGRSGDTHYGMALYAGRTWAIDRREQLLSVLRDTSVPDIARATAIELLSRQFDDGVFAAVEEVLGAGSESLQLAALQSLSAVRVESRVNLAQRFLEHPLRALRIESAKALIPARAELSAARQQDFDAAIAEYIEAQTFSADMSEGLFNLGITYDQLGRAGDAETAFLSAIDANPLFAAAYVNLADLYRRLMREAEAEALLRGALETGLSGDATIQNALGLSLVRLGRNAEALEHIALAAALAPEDPYHTYVYGVSLNSADDAGESMRILTAAHEQFPGYAPIVFALATMSRDAGDLDRALVYAEALLALNPSDASAQSLRRALLLQR